MLAPQSADTLRAALDSVFAGPRYRWAETPAPFRRLAALWRALGDWLRELEAANPAVFRALVWVLLAVLAAILLHAVWVFARTLLAAGRSERTLGAAAPAERRDRAWYTAAADRAAAAGHYAEALQLGFVALVLGLEARGAVRYHPSKTPVEYVREAQLAPAERERLRGLVRLLYAVAFGGAPCDAEGWQRWRAAAAGAAGLDGGGQGWHAPAH